MNRLVFVTSLERSGSTLLDLTLGRHPQLVSFGEVARVILPHGRGGIATVLDRPCSCGQIVRECPFWGPVTQRIHPQEEALTLVERYRIFLEQFSIVYGERFTPVDSSKFLQAIDALCQLDGKELALRVLFTVRDVRGWTSSSRSASRRKQEIPYGLLFSPDIKDRWLPYLRYNVLRHFPMWLPLEWYLRNGRIQRSLTRHGLSVKRTSYERLALKTEETLADIFKFIGVDNVPLGDRSISHIVRGNRMAFDPAKNSSIHYDGKWLAELWTQYEAMALPFVMSRNARWVYERG